MDHQGATWMAHLANIVLRQQKCQQSKGSWGRGRDPRKCRRYSCAQIVRVEVVTSSCPVLVTPRTFVPRRVFSCRVSRLVCVLDHVSWSCPGVEFLCRVLVAFERRAGCHMCHVFTLCSRIVSSRRVLVLSWTWCSLLFASALSSLANVACPA